MRHLTELSGIFIAMFFVWAIGYIAKQTPLSLFSHFKLSACALLAVFFLIAPKVLNFTRNKKRKKLISG